MHRFSTKEFEAFFGRVDQALKKPCTIVLTGGGAVGLKYKGLHSTSDLDLWTVSEKSFWEAVQLANSGPVRIPVNKVTSAEPPYHFEDRLIPLHLQGLSKLTVLVPEAHDLVLLKIARAESHDLDAVEDIHRATPLKLGTLISRYLETTTQAIGSVERHRLNFLAAVARLFGETKANEVDLQLGPNRSRKKS